MSLFSFLKSPSKYTNTESLVSLQSVIIKDKLTKENSKSYLKELSNYDICFINVGSVNPVASNNIAIRQNLVKAILYYVIGNVEKCRECKKQADKLFENLITNEFYDEGYSYFCYVKEAYEAFYSNVLGGISIGFTYSKFLDIESNFIKISNPFDGRVPVNETAYTCKFDDLDFIPKYNVYLDRFTKIVDVEREIYILISHNKDIYKNAHKGHNEYDFGHVVVWHKGEYKLIHKWYPGYSTKEKSPIKHSWNNNIVSNGYFTSEPFWRQAKFKNGHNLEIVKDYSNAIEISLYDGSKWKRYITYLNGILEIVDYDGECSHYNVTENLTDYSVNCSEIGSYNGFHSPDYGKVEVHKRLTFRGKVREFKLFMN